MTESPILSVRDVVIDERGGKARFVVWLDDESADEVRVDYATGDGSALAGRDYVASAGTLVFAPGQTSRTVDVAIRDDAAAEGRETFGLDLSNAIGGTIVDGSGAALIGASDGAAASRPALRAEDVIVSEHDGVATVIVSLSAPSTRTVRVDYATAYDGAGRDDVTASSGQLVFTAGQTTQTLRLAVHDDALAEGRESLRLLLSHAQQATIADATARVTIVDDDGTAYVQSGGRSDDTYLVSATGDVIVENPGGGHDVVRSTVDYRLGADVEDLVLLGSAVRGTGNALANRITGTSAANQLDGGAGRDTLVGGNGNDRYVVDRGTDVIVETSATSTQIDSVLASATYTLPRNVERLTLTGSRAIDGAGNALDNAITGNAAANRLSGGGGDDTLSGGARGDLLDGGTGRDVLAGGSGGDTFRFTSRPSSANADRITDFRGIDDRLLFENAVFTRIGAAGKLPARAFVVGTHATDAADRLVYDRGTGQLFYDPDGSGSAAKLLVAALGAGTVLTLDDLWIS